MAAVGNREKCTQLKRAFEAKATDQVEHQGHINTLNDNNKCRVREEQDTVWFGEICKLSGLVLQVAFLPLTPYTLRRDRRVSYKNIINRCFTLNANEQTVAAISDNCYLVVVRFVKTHKR